MLLSKIAKKIFIYNNIRYSKFRTILLVSSRHYAKLGDDSQNEDSKKSEKNLQVCTITENMVDPCKPEPRIVIIGAGMAGLSAAQRLAQCGLSNFHILEATDRPGGRIHSCWLGDVIAELGAEYIRGASAANPIYNLACQECLLSSPIQRCGFYKGMFFTSDGRAVDLGTSVTAYHTFRQIEQEAATLFNMGSSRVHGNMLHFLGIRINQELQNFPEDQRYDVARVMYGLTHMVREECGDDLRMVSADQYGSHIKIPGGDVRIPLGYVGVIAPLLRELPPCSLHYCKPVNKINWGAYDCPGRRATVTCCDGEKFDADYVIVTTSLGVLKEHSNTLFCPRLPAEKSEAIHSLGYGMFNKVYLEYSRPFWAWNEGGIKFAWSPEELGNRTDWLKGLSAVVEVEGSKHVLCALVSGPEAAQMELASDEETAEGITNILRQFTGDCTLPFPKTILRSRWATDPYFCGSFSYMALDSTVRHQCDLSSPLPGPCEPCSPVLLFAGEATCVGHYSTVHGARLSGVREAERIIQLTKKHGGPPPIESQQDKSPCVVQEPC